MVAQLYSLDVNISTMHYNTIFDVTRNGFDQWANLPVGLIVIGVFVGFVYYLQRSGRLSSYKFYVLFCFAIVSMLVFRPIDSFLKYRSLCTALRSSRCAVIEGVVSHLHPLYWIRRGDPGEAFSVKGIKFTYREASAQVGFHQVGIIRDGMHVRIHYVNTNNPQIALLESAK